MKEIKEVYKKSGNLHHAYLIEGERDFVVGEICKFLESDLDFKIIGNPDFWNEEYVVFGIDDARKIKETQIRKSFGNKKIFILSCNSMTTEAQNSLLKLFEEPTEGTHFFVVSNSSEFFLPTLRSRMVIIKSADSPRHGGASADLSGLNTDQGRKENFDFVEKFLNTKKAERLKIIKDIVEEKDKEKAIMFLNNLEIKLREKVDFSSKEQTYTLKEIMRCRDYLNDRAPSVKLILEHLSLITPQIK
ncbi:MAG: hypothetical protein WC849_02835 [Candidatus Paceibacterota bacterium]